MEPIIGKRHKCTTCANVDFCQSCFSKQDHRNTHELHLVILSNLELVPYTMAMPEMVVNNLSPDDQNDGARRLSNGIERTDVDISTSTTLLSAIKALLCCKP
ncbi:hypothetical protein BC938DRAFT_484309 [Jimgerdemannia flammicorona]|uniref:ZZ-type domain-containing protein n=1 Tax=Jimgerdemannia flammicorona TaxID=994334 RepID=A0A433QA29_9FUNG|nr:hypothetical protein BC938DRAFT_484309 [Jimgerdemannia flammicorona]